MTNLQVEGDSLLETMSVLWPDAEVSRVSGGASHHEGDHLVLPGGRETAVPMALAAHVVQQSSAAAGPGPSALRCAYAGALRLGLGGVGRDRIRVSGSEQGSLAEFLGERLGERVQVAVSTGTARVNRKPVVEIFGDGGRSRGFAKLGFSSVVWDDIRAEAEALDSVAEVREHGIRVPTRVWYGAWHGMPVLLMTSVPHGRWHRRRDRNTPPIEEMRVFTAAFAEPARRLPETQWWARVRSRLTGLADTEPRQTVLSCLDTLERSVGSGPMPLSAWHGDWTPWNMARHRGRLSLWDWERFEIGVPAGLDVLHHAVNAHAAPDPEAVRRALLRAAPAWRHVVGGSPDAELASGLYLAAMAARYLPLAEGEGGELIRDRSGVFLQAWQEWSGAR